MKNTIIPFIISLIFTPLLLANELVESAPPVHKPVPSWFSTTLTDKESEEMFKEAQILKEEGEYDKAVAMFGKLAALSPSKFKPAHLEAARCHLSRDDGKRAVQWLVVYNDKYSKTGDSLFLLGKAYGLSRSYEKSVEAYESSLKLNDSDPRVHFALAMAYDRINMYSKTIEHAQKAVQLDSSYKKKLQPLIKNSNLASDVGKIVDEVLRHSDNSQLSDEQINDFARRVGEILGEDDEGQATNNQIDEYIRHIKSFQKPASSN